MKLGAQQPVKVARVRSDKSSMGKGVTSEEALDLSGESNDQKEFLIAPRHSFYPLYKW